MSHLPIFHNKSEREFVDFVRRYPTGSFHNYGGHYVLFSIEGNYSYNKRDDTINIDGQSRVLDTILGTERQEKYRRTTILEHSGYFPKSEDSHKVHLVLEAHEKSLFER